MLFRMRIQLSATVTPYISFRLEGVISEPEKSGLLAVKLANQEMAGMIFKGLKCTMHFPNATQMDGTVQHIDKKQGLLSIGKL